jgi:drug/metabolite transporter (DMT)-like permease
MNRHTRWAMVAAFGAVYLFWGGTFLAIRYAVADLPPLLTIGLRCAGGAAVLFGWLAVRGRLERASLAAWGTAAAAGALLFLACHAVMASVEQRVSSGETAVWMTAIPLWLVILDAVRARRRPALAVVLGLGLGAAGVLVLSAGDGMHPERAADHAALLACAFGWALGSLVGRHGPRPVSAVQSTAMQLLTGSVFVLLASALFEPWSGARLTARSAGSMGFLIVCGTAIGLAAYTWLLRMTTPAAVGTFSFVNPVIALLLGWAVGDDRLGARTLVATCLILSAVLATQWKGLLAPRLAPAATPGTQEAGDARAAPRGPGTAAAVTGGERRLRLVDPVRPSTAWVRLS